jgi:hypothetical protein
MSLSFFLEAPENLHEATESGPLLLSDTTLPKATKLTLPILVFGSGSLEPQTLEIILKLAPASSRPQSSFPDRRQTLDATRFPFIQPPRCATTHRSSTPAAIYGTPYGRGVRNTSRRKSDAQRTSLPCELVSVPNAPLTTAANTGSMRSAVCLPTLTCRDVRLRAPRRLPRQSVVSGSVLLVVVVIVKVIATRPLACLAAARALKDCFGYTSERA